MIMNMKMMKKPRSCIKRIRINQRISNSTSKGKWRYTNGNWAIKIGEERSRREEYEEEKRERITTFGQRGDDGRDKFWDGLRSKFNIVDEWYNEI